MKVLIIEDEQVAAEKMENMLSEIDPAIQVQDRLGSVKESVSWFSKNSADIVFMDIQLSDGICFDIFERVSVNTPVIFTTAYDQYAIKAFEVNSVSYLLKPIRLKDLREALEKFKSLKHSLSMDLQSLVAQLKGNEPPFRKRFLIQIGEKIKKIEVEEIAYFYAQEKGVYLKLFKGNSYPVEFSLDKLENILDPEHFFRVNRKFLVNMKAIQNMTAYSRGRIKVELNPPMHDGFEVIVSIDRVYGFRRWLNS
ncbi:LytR/AlgR family response regulator transcription factor [Marinilabilia rubra]|uniref:DNA-binding response regulator n=1 Tax=Marinilabilia rubra TaxID=2162893 RepID=A0A2U2B454_9BACT|nr:LytTR family DNA-binding domain-containing protein [Marinilabilia rubra]PWD97845.1 DNA-binding response regulator [Marinilabilia rubra]